MKRVVKTHPPQELLAWCDENKELNHSYHNLVGTEAHQKLKNKLLKEQGQICAYTGRTIVDTSSHIEHLKPQNQCEDWEDVDYRNVVACFPADGGDKSHGYGAPVKGGWWNKDLFISPLSEDCERRFRFVWSGHIHPVPEDHEGAKKTIEIIGLDRNELCELRRARINGFFGFGVRSRSKPLSIADARIALENIDRLEGSGQLREFCFVLKQLLPKYIENGTNQ